MEDPSKAKGLVRREVTRVVTPGTVTEDEILDAARNNYIAAIYVGKKLGLALLDLSTGAFTVEAVPDDDALADLLKRYAPSECLIGREALAVPRTACPCCRRLTLSPISTTDVQYDCACDRPLRQFQVHSLEAMVAGVAGWSVRRCAGSLRQRGVAARSAMSAPCMCVTPTLSDAR